MDLVAGVRKEGSRGGRADFKWEDVKDDAQRENYLGHSLMAPVGRWQKNRDLNWYAKASQTPAEQQTAAEARKEELRKIKEAEQDALSEALGYGPMPGKNANETPLGKKEVEKAIKESAGDEEEEGGGGAKGVGFGHLEALQRRAGRGEQSEVLGGVGMDELVPQTGGRSDGSTEKRREEERRRRSRSRSRERDGKRHRHRERHHRRSRSRDRSRDRRPRRRDDEYDGKRRGHRRRSPEETPRREYRDRSRDYGEKRRDRDRYGHHRRRSSSPEPRRRDGSYDRYRDRRR